MQQDEEIREGVEAVRRKAKGVKNRLCSLRPTSTQYSRWHRLIHLKEVFLNFGDSNLSEEHAGYIHLLQ